MMMLNQQNIQNLHLYYNEKKYRYYKITILQDTQIYKVHLKWGSTVSQRRQEKIIEFEGFKDLSNYLLAMYLRRIKRGYKKITPETNYLTRLAPI